MVYVTGDTHGDLDLAKLSSRLLSNIEGFDADAEKYVLVCGDFGLIWYPEDTFEYVKELRSLDWLAKQGYTTLFIDGNHENFDRLNAYPEQMWHGGKVHKIRENIIHLMRGQVFEVCGKTLFTMGGAVSIDKQYRTPKISWWSQEVPTYREFEEAETNLERYNWTVDYVITHATDDKHLKQIDKHYKSDCVTKMLSELIPKITYKHWYGGHYHMDKELGDYTCLYDWVKVI